MLKERHSVPGMVLAAMFGAAIAIGAYIAIPLQPVPITLQNLFIYLAAALLGSHLGALSTIIYVTLGIMGLPVFAGGKAGFGVLMGPTGGYLSGYIVCAYVTGKMIEIRKNPGFIWMVFSMAVGSVFTYLFGVAQLSMYLGIPAAKAVTVGVFPFLPGDALKIAAAALIAARVRDKLPLFSAAPPSTPDSGRPTGGTSVPPGDS